MPQGSPKASRSASHAEGALPSGPDVRDASFDQSLKAWRKRAYAIWAIIGLFIVLFGVGYLLGVMSIPVGILIWSAFIVFCLRGLVNAIQKRGLSRFMSVVLAYVVFAGVLGAIGFLMSSPFFGIGDQFKSLLSSIPEYITGVQDAFASFSRDHPEIMSNPIVSEAAENLSSSVAGAFQSFMSSGLDNLANIGVVVANSAACIGFALVAAFWMLLEAPGLGREVRRISGGAHQEGLDFFYITFTRVVGGYIKGMLVQCGLIALGCVIMFAILGVPNAVAFAIITGLLNFIPVVGPWLGGVAAGAAALGGGAFFALLVIALTVAWQQVVYTFISPKIMSDTVDVHPMLVIFAMMIGSSVGTAMSGFIGGLVGMLLGIPAAALIKALFVYYFEKRTGRTIVAEDGVFFKGHPSSEGSAIADATGQKRIRDRIRHRSGRPAEPSEGVKEAADSAARSDSAVSTTAEAASETPDA